MRREGDQDSELAARCAAGDKCAVELFYRTYADLLFAFLRHRTRLPRSEVEDIWQETLLAALRSFARFEGRSSLWSWLCAIGRHKAADHIRCRAREPAVDADGVDAVDGAMAASPEAAVLAGERRIRVLEVLGDMPQGYRQVLVERYLRGRSVAGCALLLRRSYKATESLLSRAREAFRLRYEPEEGP